MVVLDQGGGHDQTDGDRDGTTNDQLDMSDLVDGQGSSVKVFDVTISNDGHGNAVLNFPGGEQVTVLGLSPASAGARMAWGVRAVT